MLCSGALGDTLLLSAVLQDFRAAYPDAEIVLCCMPQNVGAAALIPGADRRLLLHLTKPRHSITLLRAERFDMLADFTAWQRITAFLTLASGAGFSAGFSSPGMHRGRGYDFTVPHRRDLHEVDNFRALTRALEVPSTHPPALISLPPEALTSLWPHDAGRPITLLHLWPSGARSALREWPEDRWMELAERLRTLVPDAIFGLSCTPAERARTDAVVRQMKDTGIEAYPVQGTFLQLAALIKRAHLVVSVNTGVMHLAAIAGTPTVSLNGPTSNLRWGPVGPRTVGVNAGGDCGYLHLGFEFKGAPTDCMERITVDAVLGACESVMTTAPPAAA